MRTVLVLFLATACCGLVAAEPVEPLKAYAVVFYHEHTLVDGQPVQTSKSLILSRVEQTTIAGQVYLSGTVPDQIGSEIAGTTVSIRADLVYLVMSTDSDRAAKALTNSAAKGVWRTVSD